MTTQANRAVESPVIEPVAVDVVAGRPGGARVPAIAALTGIRALAAGWVVVHHFRDPMVDLLPGLRFLAPPVWSGYIGVEVFFVLSGFIIAYNYAEKVRSRPSYQKYLWARAARIYPVHLVTMFMMVGLAFAFPSEPELVKNVTPGNVVANLFVLQAVPPFTSVNGPSWSVSCEIAAYLVFPLLAWWALKLSPRAAASWAAALLLGGVLAIGAIPIEDTFWQIAYPVLWLRIVSEFAAGVLLWVWWRSRPRGSARWDVAALAGLGGAVCVTYLIDPMSRATMIATPFLALFVISSASATGPLARLLSSPIMQWGGKISYSLYMSHYVIFYLLLGIVPWREYTEDPLPIRLALAGVLALWILGTAACLYHFVEEPARKFALAWWAGRQSAGGHKPSPAESSPAESSPAESSVQVQARVVEPGDRPGSAAEVDRTARWWQSGTILGVASVLVVFGVLAWQQRWISDDGLIVVREIRQILAGNGPNYNPFQRDEVNTSVLWTWLGVAAALVFRGDVPASLVGLGAVLSVAGLGFAMAGSVRFHRARGMGGLLGPAGALIVVAVAGFWDFATSGLETGLSLCWLGLVWWLISGVDERTGTPQAVVTAVVVGAGSLVRPDFALVTVVFGAMFLWLAAPTRGRGLAYIGAAAALPVGYEVFRAGYYGVVIPAPGLAKEASSSLWGRGFVYLQDFVGTYALIVPMAVIGAVLITMVGRRSLDRRAAVCLAAPLASGLLMGCYILRVGGDYMHARMWLPVVVTMLLPVMMLPVGRNRRLETGGVLMLAVWALLAGLFARTPYQGMHAGPNGIVNQRGYEAALFGADKLMTAEARLNNNDLLAQFQRLTADGGRTFVLAGGRDADQRFWSIPLAPGLPDRTAFFFSKMGIAQVVSPLETTVVDINGLATPLAGHIRVNRPGRPGHEKWLPPAWALAAYADPAATAVMPDTRDATRAEVRAARHALSCGALKELMDSTDQPMTWPRFWANLTGAITRTSLRVPADPIAAEQQFCH